MRIFIVVLCLFYIDVEHIRKTDWETMGANRLRGWSEQDIRA